MKNIYITILCVWSTFALNAQLINNVGPVARSYSHASINKPLNTPQEKAITIWSSTFDTPAEWVISHDIASCNLDWTIGTDTCSGFFPINDIESTTASDGWAMVDSDGYNAVTGGTETENSWLTMAAPVDLNLYPNVVVEFETQYRRYNEERPYVVVGIGDGTGPSSVVWPVLDPYTDISGMNNVFEAFPNWADGATSDNSELIHVNISSALTSLNAAQLGDIYIRLQWTGTWGYAWFVDDFSIIEQPADDIRTIAGWISGVNNGGVQYGKNPDSQLDPSWLVGAEVFNYGSTDQNNIVMTADFTSFSSVANDLLLMSDSTVILENTESPILTPGIYTGTYTSVSDEETGGAEFANNVYNRTFEVSTAPQMVYALDGSDVYPSPNLSSIGSKSFDGGADGLVIASMYHIKTPTTISGIRSMLVTTGPDATMFGSEVYASIKDTATFWAGDMTSLFECEHSSVSAANLTNGYIDSYFSAPITLDSGVYYAAVQLITYDNTNVITLIDDETVNQPARASAIYIHNDQSYTNGTASGVRLLMGSDWNVGISEIGLDGVSIYPNPSTGEITITNKHQNFNTIHIRDILGNFILQKNGDSNIYVDLNKNGAGVYFVSVSNSSGSVTEKVTIR